MNIISPIRKSIISASVLAALPKKGVSGKWYRVDDSVYLWSDIDQDYFAVGSGGSVAWADITGDPSDNADLVTALDAVEASAFDYTDTQIAALTASGESWYVMQADGVANSLTNTWSDVETAGGAKLRIAVVSGKMYYFEVHTSYNSSSTAVGSKWGIDGPSPTYLAYESHYSLSATTTTFNHGMSAMQLPAGVSGNSAATTGNRATISGFYMPSADGYLQVIFACETNLGSITPKAGSYIKIKNLY